MSVKNRVLTVFLVLIINLPLVHSTWIRHRVDTAGIETTAQVSDAREIGGKYYVSFLVPAAGDRKAITGEAEVDQSTFDQARRSRGIQVRYLPSKPAAYILQGQVTSRIGLVVTIMADVFLLVMLLLLTRYRSRLRAVLVLVAEEDLERCPPGAVLDRLSGMRYVVCGEVHAIEDDAVVLELGDRRVKVLLDGHHNPAGFQQPVRATGTMIA